MPLRDFQVTGSGFLQSHPAALLCDDAGLGKSAQVLDAADTLGLKRILCIGPAVAAVSWPIQLATWSPTRKFVNIDLGVMFGFELPGFYFVSYDTLSLKKNEALALSLRACSTWDALVLDEAQYLKNFASNRTQAVYGGVMRFGINANARRTWVLSGTLTPNHAGEAYTHLRTLFPLELRAVPAFKNRVPEQHEFEDHFCSVRETVYGRAISGSKNMRELKAVLAPVLLRRRKQDVLQELPPIEWLTAPIDVPVSKIDDILVSLYGFTNGTGTQEQNEYIDACHAERLDGAPMSTARRELGLAKVPGCLAWIIDRLEAGEPKIVVFAHHKDVLRQLYEGLLDYNPVVFTGATGPKEREYAVGTFQENASCRVFIGQIQAAGTAITLTAAKTAFFAEFAGTPGVNYQAASRLHRIGQREGVQVYFASVPNSLDERIAATAKRRAREISEIFD